MSPWSWLRHRLPLRWLLFFHLLRFDLHRRGAAQDRQHDLQCISIGIYVLDDTREILERPIDDLDGVAAIESELRLGLFRSYRNAIDYLVDFFLCQRRRLLAGANEAGHLGRAPA